MNGHLLASQGQSAVEAQMKAYETGMQQFIAHLKCELENDQPSGVNRHFAEMTESPLQQCDIERS
jgi:hypothetical protein